MFSESYWTVATVDDELKFEASIGGRGAAHAKDIVHESSQTKSSCLCTERIFITFGLAFCVREKPPFMEIRASSARVHFMII